MREKLHATDVLIPYKQQQGGCLSIRFRARPGVLEVSIEDDGPGLSAKNKNRGISLGLRLSCARSDSYNRLFGLNTRVCFIEKQEAGKGSGVIVIIHIPHKPHKKKNLKALIVDDEEDGRNIVHWEKYRPVSLLFPLTTSML